MQPPRVHLITDRDICPDPVSAARAALAGLAPRMVAVHLRDKALDGRAMLELASAMAAVVHERGQLLLVNDRVDVAVAAGADGVHLPSAGIPPAEARRLVGPARLVGVSCHAVDDVRRARAGGADYATFGPLYDTPSKRAYGKPVGLGALRAAAREGLPLIGLGGVDLANAREVLDAGAHGIGAIRAWSGSGGEPAAAVQALTRMTMGDSHRDHHGNPADFDAYIAKMESDERSAWQHPDEVVAALRVLPGQVVADVGTGPGYFAIRLARTVGPTGRVFAVDVSAEMVGVLRDRLARSGVENVTPVLASADEPGVPAPCDLILMVNAFHHVHDPRAYLERLSRHLATGGRIAVVDFHKKDMPVGPPVEHKLAREELLAAAQGAGLRVVAEEKFLPYQYLFVLSRA